MIKRLTWALCLSLALVTATLSAKTIKVPDEDPAVTVNVPESWNPEQIEKGITTESEDKEATIFFEITEAKDTSEVLDENIKWLKGEKVTIDPATKTEKDFKAGSMSWSSISWKGTSEEWGPATIGFAFSDVGHGKVLVMTYWITKKGMALHEAELNKIFESVKKIKG